MKGVNFNEQLKVLFEKWTKESEFTHFFYDGLMNRGKIENPNWRSSGNEDELWNNAPKRIMFLLKDVNAGGDGPEDDDDIRGRNFKDTNSRTYLNMSYWLFGILKTIEMGEIPKYTFSNSESTQFFDDTPVAYVNCKKEAGKSSVSHNTLVNYIERDKKYIVEEIEILNPDIIVCCAWTEGSGNPIFDLVEKEIHKGIKKINGWMYYCEETNKLVINSYHPATTVCDDAYLFNEMMKAFKEFLDKYPNFIKSCRTIEYDDSYDTENEDCNNVTMQETNLCPNCKKEIEITLHSKYRQVKCEHCDSRFDSNMIETIEYIKARLDYRIRYFHEKDLKFVANKLWLSGAGSRDIDEILDDLENPEETPFAINKCDLEYMQNAKKSLIGWGWFLATHRLSSAYKKYRDNVLFEDSLPLLFHWLIWGVVATALAWILPANFWLSFILSFVACEVILLLFDYSKMSKKQKESMERLEECIYEEGENVSENIKNKNYEIIKNIEILIEKFTNDTEV